MNLGLDMNWAHKVLDNADDINLIGDYIRGRKRNPNLLSNTCNGIDLAINVPKLGTLKYNVLRV